MNSTSKGLQSAMAFLAVVNDVGRQGYTNNQPVFVVSLGASVPVEVIVLSRPRGKYFTRFIRTHVQKAPDTCALAYVHTG